MKTSNVILLAAVLGFFAFLPAEGQSNKGQSNRRFPKDKLVTVIENEVFDPFSRHVVQTQGFAIVSIHTSGIDCNFAEVVYWQIDGIPYGRVFGIHGDETDTSGRVIGRTLSNGVAAPEMVILGNTACPTCGPPILGCTSPNATIKVYLRVEGGDSENN